MRALAALFLLVSTASAAPVPKHLGAEAPPADPIRQGFRWVYYGVEYEVVQVVGQAVWYRCVSEPDRFHLNYDWGMNCQSRRQTLKEAGMLVESDPWGYESPMTVVLP